MSFLFSGERKTAPEWRMGEEGMMSFFKDEFDEIPITRDEWESGEYRQVKSSLKKDSSTG